MKITTLIKNIKIVDPTSKNHLKKVDILIEKGIITKIASKINSNIKNVIESKDSYVSGTWFDALANFCEPGFEHKEDIASGINSAVIGGFGHVGISPNTQPIIENKYGVEFIKSKSNSSHINLHPISAATINLEGKVLTEIHDMASSGSIGFVQTNKFSDMGNLSRSMQYVKDTNKVFLSVPFDNSFVPAASVNESTNTLKLGLRGTPNIAEFVNVERDLNLAKYHDSNIHFSLISCKESVDLIRKAKKKGIKVTASVSIAHLLYTDDALETYDSNYKVYPPLRSKKDQLALKKGVMDGTIDIIVSNHEPQDTESKNLEFGYAQFGMSCIQTMLPMLKIAFGDDYLKAIPCISTNPYQVFGIKKPEISVNKTANITIWSDNSWNFNIKTNPSKSKNNPLYDLELKGKVEMLIIDGELV